MFGMDRLGMSFHARFCPDSVWFPSITYRRQELPSIRLCVDFRFSTTQNFFGLPGIRSSMELVALFYDPQRCQTGVKTHLDCLAAIEIFVAADHPQHLDYLGRQQDADSVQF